MTISLHESHLSLTEAARLIPGRPNISTIWGWANRGVRGRRLETVRVGGRTFTAREAIERFLEQRGSHHELEPSERRRLQVEAAERACEAAGI